MLHQLGTGPEPACHRVHVVASACIAARSCVRPQRKAAAHVCPHVHVYLFGPLILIQLRYIIITKKIVCLIKTVSPAPIVIRVLSGNRHIPGTPVPGRCSAWVSVALCEGQDGPSQPTKKRWTLAPSKRVQGPTVAVSRPGLWLIALSFFPAIVPPMPGRSPG